MPATPSVPAALAAAHPDLTITVMDTSCPMQVAGLLDASEAHSGFLFHYRYGEATLLLTDGGYEVSIEHGDSLDSSLDETEFVEVFTRLIDEMTAPVS
jgi:hypothetical protein